jgi:hypothetical protein
VALAIALNLLGHHRPDRGGFPAQRARGFFSLVLGISAMIFNPLPDVVD